MPSGEDQVLSGADLFVLVEREVHTLGETVSALTEEDDGRRALRSRRDCEAVVDMNQRVGHLRRRHGSAIPVQRRSLTRLLSRVGGLQFV